MVIQFREFILSILIVPLTCVIEWWKCSGRPSPKNTISGFMTAMGSMEASPGGRGEEREEEGREGVGREEEGRGREEVEGEEKEEGRSEEEGRPVSVLCDVFSCVVGLGIPSPPSGRHTEHTGIRLCR